VALVFVSVSSAVLAGSCCAMSDIVDQPDHPLHLNVVCCVQMIGRRCGVDVKIVVVACQF